MGRPVQDFTFFVLTQIVICLIWSSLISSVPYTTVSMKQPANGVLNSLDPKETGLDAGKTSFPTETINQCEDAHSCTHGCPSQPTACQCDELCHLFDDCCRNVSCNSDVTSIPEFDQLGITLDQINCIKPVIPGTMTNLYNGIFMVDKCDDFASPLAKNCHTPNETDVQSFVPVSEKTYFISFRNVYCALCNDILLDDLIWWTLKADCDETVDDVLQDSLKNVNSFAATLNVISNFCPLSFNHPNTETKTLGNRVCYPNVVDSKSCSSNASQDQVNKCEEYPEYVMEEIYSSEPTIYRNIECFLCQQLFINYNDYRVELICDISDIPVIYVIYIKGILPGPRPTEGVAPGFGGIRPISVIVDFNSQKGVTLKVNNTVVTVQTVTCQANEVYDPFVDQCRVLRCLTGYALRGDRCVIDSSNVECNGLAEFDISALNPRCSQNGSNRITSDCLKEIYFSSFIIVNETIECSGTDQGQYTLKTEYPGHFEDLENIYDAIFLFDNSSKQNSCNVTNFTVSIVCEPLLPDCSNTTSFTGISVENTNNDTYIATDNARYPFLGGVLSLSYVSETEKFIKSITAEICQTELFSCSLIILNASLFTNYSSNELVYESTGKLFSKNEYMYTSDGQIQVCSFLERNGTRNITETITFLAYDTPQTILSVVGCTISMLALLFTFVTYCVFSSLRSRAIKAIMSLVAAMFTAQLVFLFGAGRISNSITCTFIAALLHYLWLCTFTWSTVLSFDLNRTFSTKMALTYVEKKRIGYKYLLHGWGSPMLVIIPCLVLHLCACSDVPFQYGNESACWIYNQYANLVVFGGPLMICMLVNLILFCNTMWSIHSTKSKTRAVSSHKHQFKDELLIYARIATLMGFTWIFAFLAAFSGVSALWYIYIIINSLQGLYIFFAFTFKRNIGRLWLKKFGMESRDDKSSNKKTTRSTNVNSSQIDRSINLIQRENMQTEAKM
ncbi:uncharacterized protein [Amphiura filiformis]|uniref:uncharacterized protein n=1 Tax=Amphiura filiformis TaxID=82378 RepID=UPI003B21E5D0